MDKKVREERQKSIKYVIVKSSRKEDIAREMGLDFNNKVYDMNIIVRNNELFGMNYEDYMDKIQEDDFAFWECTDDKMISYFDINFDSIKKYMLADIVIGPKSNTDDKDLRMFLMSNGYDLSKINIRKSKATYQ